MSAPAKVNIQEKFSLFSDHWSPKIVAQLNDTHIKLVKVQGEFVWHKHDDVDEMFLIVKGNLTIQFRDKNVDLSAGEMVVIPKGVEHCPLAKEEVCLMLIEPAGTVNTGDAKDSDKTVSQEAWI